MNAQYPKYPGAAPGKIDESRYDEWQTLPAMFFDQAERLGGRPLLIAKRDGVWRRAELERSRRRGRQGGGRPEEPGRRAWRPGRHRVREPSGMADRRFRDHAAGGDHGAGLYHQHHGGPSPYAARQRRPRGAGIECGLDAEGAPRRPSASRYPRRGRASTRMPAAAASSPDGPEMLPGTACWSAAAPACRSSRRWKLWSATTSPA